MNQSQVDHIQEHRFEFFELMGEEQRSVFDYFMEYRNKWDDPNELYLRLCSDLDLTPRKAALDK